MRLRLLCRRKAKSTAVSLLSLACIVTSIVILRNITTYWPHRLILFSTSGLQRSFPESSVLGGDTDSEDSVLERFGRGGGRRRLEPRQDATRAVCKGLDVESTLRAEVEDLLCLPKPNYLPNLKNPCWWENVTDPSFRIHHQVIDLRMPQRKLRCLPYFHILCCSKSGTTDLYHRIAQHPDIVPNIGMFGKEQLYWGWSKYGYKTRLTKGTPRSFTKYIDSFASLAVHLYDFIERTQSGGLQDNSSTRLITLDGSPPDMWDFRGWQKLPQNRNLREPAVLTPHLMRHLYRDPKFIVLMRDPIERLYTAYLFHHVGDSAHAFHSDVIRSIVQLDKCLENAPSRRECYFNASVLDRLTVEIHFTCYAVYIKEWLAVFPREHFLFIRTENYTRDIESYLLQVFEFLNMSIPTTKLLQTMVNMPVTYRTKEKETAGPMLQETRDLLREYVKPCNAELAELMHDDSYLWNDVDLPQNI